MFKINSICKNPDTRSNDNAHARRGEFETAHGKVQTPAFMPVATKAYVKTVTPEDLIELGTEVIIANSFLLYLRPGLDVIEEVGGLHKFMNWSRSIFTDSGGFQIIRPDFHAKVDDSGITFRSPFDGAKHLFTPELCVEVQAKLGVDVAMVLDHCPEYGSTPERVRSATEQTTDWAKRSIDAVKSLNEQKFRTLPLPKLFGIVQGGVDRGLREYSAKSLSKLDFDGFGIGGLSIGEPKELMHEILKIQVPLLLKDKPRYLMGVGSPLDLLESIATGVDIFDSVFPTRNARHGTVHTRTGNININRASYSKQYTLLDEDCKCATCAAGFTRAYISHLLKNYSILGMRLATIHNIYFIQNLLNDARECIEDGTFFEFKAKFFEEFKNKNNNIS
jgi:queuine tRNA-ribosyltransferase